MFFFYFCSICYFIPEHPPCSIENTDLHIVQNIFPTSISIFDQENVDYIIGVKRTFSLLHFENKLLSNRVVNFKLHHYTTMTSLNVYRVLDTRAYKYK